MLNHYITSPVLIDRLKSTPCWHYLDGFTNWLANKQFAEATVQLYLFGIPPLGQWLLKNNVSISDLNDHNFMQFQVDREASGDLYYGSVRTFKAAFIGARRFQEYLISAHILSPQLPPVPENPLLSDFEDWMVDHCGIKQNSINCYARYINDFVNMQGHEPSQYNIVSVRHYFQERARRSGVPTMKMASTSVRVFLRYLVATGQCASSLPSAVPRIAHWRLSSLPRYITSEAVEQLIDSCTDLITTPQRDRAILLLLSRLALRASDVAGLQHADIDWRAGRIRVSGKGRRECWLPLTQELGDALSEYYRSERPEFDGPHFFLKSNAPRGPISARVVSSVVDRAIERTGIDAPSRGSHLLRHSAATAMLANGASLEQIGAILRHIHLDTTAIYAKVDFGLLNQVVAQWPVNSLVADYNISSCATKEQAHVE